MTDNDAARAGPPADLAIHVLHVVGRDAALRLGPMLAQVMQALSARGLKTTLVTDDAELGVRLADTPVECHLVPHVGGWRAWRLDGLLTARLAPPNVVHVWGQAGLGWLLRWARQADVPCVAHVFGTAHGEQALRTCRRASEHVVFASSALAAPLLPRFPHAAARCRVVPPAVAIPPHTSPADSGERLFTALCVGRFAEEHGLELVIDAVAQLRRNRVDLQVGLVSDGPGLGAIWRRIRERRVRECVALVDEPRLWEKVLPEVDACLVPAAESELTIVPLLAMGLGKLVIATRNQPADWFFEERTAWQFTPGSAAELAYLLTRAIEQPQKALELRTAAAQYVRAEHSIAAMIERLGELYATACGRPAAVSAATGGAS